MITINGMEPSFSKFPNNEINMTLSKAIVSSLEHNMLSKATIAWSFDDTDELFKLGMLMDVVSDFNLKTLNVNVLYLPYSRMDRKEPGVHNPFSLSVLIGMLPNYGAESVWYNFYNVHNQKAVEDILNNTDLHVTFKLPYEIQTTPDEMEYLIDSPDSNVLVVLPDKGAKARYENFIQGDKIKLSNLDFDYVVGNKKRNFVTHKILSYDLLDTSGNVLEQDTLEKYDAAIVIDDVVSYGGTFISLLDELKDNGINYASIITGNVEDSLWKGELLEHPILGSVYTTDGLTHHTSDGNKVHVQHHYR